MKYFIYQLQHDNGKLYAHITATNKQTAIDMICKAEGCPQSAIEIVEIPFPMLNHNARYLFHLYK